MFIKQETLNLDKNILSQNHEIQAGKTTVLIKHGIFVLNYVLTKNG